MTRRDEQIQDALDRLPRAGEVPRLGDDAGDAELAAYAVVYAALADDAGFALPADFAERMTARVVPAPVRPSVYERWILPVLLIASAVLALPYVLPAVVKAAALVLAPDTGVPAAMAAALVLLLLAGVEQVVRRGRVGGSGRGRG